MTKSPHKLVLRKEIVRALNTIDLARVVGGAGSGIADAVGPTMVKDCTQQQVNITPDK
jgi:hypothetical protein